MEAKKVYEKLEKDFIKEWLTDDWSFMNIWNIPEVTQNFKERFMWLLFDFSQNINSVYSAVFPSDKVIKYIIDNNIENSILFVHHPANWDSRKPNNAFENIPQNLIEELKNRKISIYNLHSPLDNYSKYSTSKTLSDVLWFKEVWKFVKYEWWLAGIIAKQGFLDINSLAKHISEILWHKVKIIKNWEENINWELIWIVAGWWVDMLVISEMIELNIKTLITWVSLKNSFTEKALNFAKENGINIISWTHYSTEKYACIKMVDYFKKLWLKSEFIEDIPVFEDL